MSEERASRGWLGAFAVLAVIWGSSFLFIKVGVTQVSPPYVSLARTAIGALTLIAVLAITRDRLPRDLKLWGHLAFVAFLSNVVPYTLFGYAEDGRVSSVLAGIWNATTPLSTVLVMIAVFPQERATRQRVVGLILGFTGVLVVLGVWAGTGGSSLSGQMMCFIAATCYGVTFPYVRRFLAHRPESGAALAGGQILMAAIELCFIAPLLAGRPGNPFTLHFTVIAAIIALGSLGTGIAFVLNYRIIRRAGASTASTVTYLMPIVATIAGVLVLGEQIRWYEPVGALVILLGVAVSQGRLPLRSTRRTRPVPAPEPVTVEVEPVGAGTSSVAGSPVR